MRERRTHKNALARAPHTRTHANTRAHAQAHTNNRLNKKYGRISVHLDDNDHNDRDREGRISKSFELSAAASSTSLPKLLLRQNVF